MDNTTDPNPSLDPNDYKEPTLSFTISEAIVLFIIIVAIFLSILNYFKNVSKSMH